MICYSRRWSVLYDAVCCMIIAMLYDLLLGIVWCRVLYDYSMLYDLLLAPLVGVV